MYQQRRKYGGVLTTGASISHQVSVMSFSRPC